MHSSCRAWNDKLGSLPFGFPLVCLKGFFKGLAGDFFKMYTLFRFSSCLFFGGLGVV